MSLYKVLNNNHFDIIYIQHQNVLPVAVFVNMIFKKTVIAHLHVVYVDKVIRLVVNKCLQNKYIRKIIGVSNYTLQQLKSSNKSKSIRYLLKRKLRIRNIPIKLQLWEM